MAIIMVATVGLVQWLKGLFKKAPSWVWSITAVLLSFGFSFIGGLSLDLFIGVCVLLGAVSLAISQLCYEIIIQAIPHIAQKAMDKLDD
jgi:hypothetical protein